MLSIQVHALVLGLAWLGSSVELDRSSPRFKLPAEAEFGVLDGVSEPAQSASPPPAPPPKQADKPTRRHEPKRAPASFSAAPVATALGPVQDAGISPVEEAGELADAAVAAGSARDGGAALQSGMGTVPGAIGDGLGVGAGGHGLGGFAPPGAHVGLHVDVRRVANSSLILEVRSLLDVIPGWQRLLENSGIDPMEALTHVFVATPDLRPRSLVLSARFKYNSNLVENAVKRLAKRHGAQAPWGERGGVRSAPWYGIDGVPRVVALAGKGRFVITSEEDLARVMAVVRVLERRSGDAAQVDPHAPKALIEQYQGEAVALSIEDTREFVVDAPPAMPRRLRLSLRPLDEFRAGLSVLGQYATVDAATVALSHLQALRVKLVDHPQVKYLGMVSALSGVELKQDSRYLMLSAKLTMHQTRFLLDYVAEVMRQ